jgi:hypothetical protein
MDVTMGGLPRRIIAATHFRYRQTIFFRPKLQPSGSPTLQEQHLSFHGPFVQIRAGRRCHPATVSLSGRGRLLRLIEFAGGRLADGCDDGCCQLIALSVGEKLHQYRSY